VSNPPPQLGPAAVYRHDHPPVRNVVIEDARQRSPGQRVADGVAALVGSWPFIIVQSALLFGWIALNVYLIAYLRTHPGAWKAWDPYPFILLNLFLSMLAALQAPVIMMSQNRQDTKDRLRGELDFEVNRRAASDIQGLARKINLLGEKVGDVEDLLRAKLHGPKNDNQTLL
jgi:uncharacterized membrane protein